MRRLLAVLVPLALLAACGDDDDAGGPTTTVADRATSEPTGAVTTTTAAPDTTVPADAPAGDGPGADDDDDEGLGDVLLVADLDGASEVPGPGHPTATGRFEAELLDGELCVDLSVQGLGQAVTAAHLHEGAVGEAGGVIVDIGGPSGADADPARWAACVEVEDDVIDRIAASPEQVYVNVHTASHPDGAVRGPLEVASVFDRTLDG